MPSPPPLRLAMWSGPRNVSTAMMRAFGSRADAIVCDEPLYAHYLRETGKPHPMKEAIVREHEAEWPAVVDWLTGPLPAGKSVFYQKHMAHHLLPNIDRGWLAQLSNAFLIRNPREMLSSLLQILPEPELEDTAFPQQVELFRYEKERTGRVPAVVDSRDVLEDPAGVLGALCAHAGLEFTTDMLRWEPGVHATDGCWAEAWYGNALASTGFAPYRPKNDPIPARFAELLARCEELYSELYENRLRPGA